MNALASKASIVTSANPVLTKLRSIPQSSRRSWVQGFLNQVDRVYFASWTVAEAEAAKIVLLRWRSVYSTSEL